ncbi:serine/threonine-protein phosphatase 7 long form homolog [Lycium barbarum]|uniref:serine/threonine-protein phosphatase 7 long form homolog n=1 Tax=Lycium barbarum TaxID=112863 RepID=UPI00293F5515|nr:serine/threonine-protein phosphatase 7 long form homolog [Lycium barbarum]
MDRPKVTVHPGPENYDLLILQHEHRSQAVWDEKLTGKNASVGNVQYDEGIITTLIERWRPETHTFHMRTGECTITLQDVELLYGIPVDGHPLVQRNVKNITKSRWQELMYDLTGWFLGEEAFIGNSLLVITQLSNHLETLIAKNDIIDEHTDEAEVQKRVRLYLLWLIGGTIFPDNISSKLSLHFLLDIIDLDAIGGKAWGAAAYHTCTIVYAVLR